MAPKKGNDRLTEHQQAIYDQLAQLFPNHGQAVIRKTVLHVSKRREGLEHSLDRCIEELVNICPCDYDKQNTSKQRKDGELSVLQTDVVQQLSQIFPNQDRTIITTSVSHPSNLDEPLTQATLLQRCIDDVLDGRTAVNADKDAEFYQGGDRRNTSDNEPDDDVAIMEVEEPKDLVILSTEEAENITLSDDEESLPSVTQIEAAHKEIRELRPLSDEPNQISANNPHSSHALLPLSSGLDKLGGNDSDKNVQKSSIPVAGEKTLLKTGLSTATAHITLIEHEDEVGHPALTSHRDTTGCPSTKRDTSEYPTVICQRDATGYPSMPSQRETAGYPTTTYQRETAGYPTTTYQGDTAGYPTTTYQRETAGYPTTTYQRDTAGYPTTTYQRDTAGYPTTTYQRETARYHTTTYQRDTAGYPAVPSQSHIAGYPARPCPRDTTGYPTIPSVRDTAGYPTITSKSDSTAYPTTTPSTMSQRDAVRYPTITSWRDTAGYPTIHTHRDAARPPSIISQGDTAGHPTINSQRDTTRPPSITSQWDTAGYRSIPQIDTATSSNEDILIHTGNGDTSLQDKQRSDQTPASETNKSFNASRADLFSSSTIEFSDSDGSLSAADSCDAQLEDDALPQITFSKKLRDIFGNPAGNSVNKVDITLNPQTKHCADVKFGDKFLSLGNDRKPENHSLDSQLLKPRSSLSSKSCMSDSLQTNFRLSAPKLLISPNSKQFPSQTFSKPSIGSDGRAKQYQCQTDGTIHPVPNRSLNWPPGASYQGSLTQTKVPPSQQTVTIESTHKITYNNIMENSVNTTNSKEDIVGKTQNYSMTTPNVTVQVPIGQPDIQFMDGFSTPIPTTAVPGNGKSAGTHVSDIGETPAYFPKGNLRNHLATHTAPNPETKDTISPIVIHSEPEDHPDRVPVLVPDDHGGHEHKQDPVMDKTPDDPIVRVKNDVLALFPDVEPDFLNTLCQQHEGPMAVNNICFLLLESKYPKKESQSGSAEKKEKLPEMSFIDFYKDYKSVVIPEENVIPYQAQAFQKLAQEFLWISANDIKSIMRRVNFFYAPSHKALQIVWKQGVEVAHKKAQGVQSALMFRGLIFQAKVLPEDVGGMECRIAIKLLKNRRPFIKTHFTILPELQREIDFVQQKLKDKEMEADHRVAMALNEQEYEDQGQCIECGCCFGEYPFEQMVQCYDGHLFCENCLRQYAKESVFGQGKADMKCMTDLCDSSFPKSQLLKALPAEILDKYEDRVTEENLNLADIGDLVKCPHCDFRAFMDPDDKVFRCQSDHCQKESCRYCQVEWEEHFGKKCSEVEKKDETTLRLEYEEKMTKAKVRICHRCKAQFMKLDGCNKMTCRCGAKMCYICRKPDIDYNHFCRHPRDPGKECTQCQACNLWTNPEEDENRAVTEIQKEAEEERKKKGFTEMKIIGVPDQPPAKKAKR